MRSGGSPYGDTDDTAPQSARAPLEPSSSTTTVSDWAAATSIGLARTRNEDRWVHLGTSAFAVADGMGGYDGGELAAVAAVERFTEAAAATTRRSEEAWRQVTGAINQHVRTSLSHAGLDAGGTTFVAVVLDTDLATVLSVGDSRVLRLRHGQLDQLTSDHTLATEMRAAGVHGGDGGLVRALTSYLGIDPDLLRVDVATYEVRQDDCLVLCSDGIHGQIPSDVMAQILNDSETASKAAQGLVDEADARGGRDNATVVVTRF